MDFRKSTLALLAGFGFIAILYFFYMLMWGKSGTVIGISLLTIILSIMMMLFLLLDKLSFCPASITETNSNLVAGMLFAIVFFMIILTFTEFDVDAFDGLLIVVLTALTSFSSFSLFYSVFMED
jgi:hypothetical protein